VLTGGVQNETFRYNLGVLNASDEQTAITVVIQPFQANGDPYLDEDENEIVRVINLAPLAHTQINGVLDSLGIEEADQAMIKVSFFSWSSSSADPIPAMTCYGSMVDNRSNDPTTILPSFASPYNVECMFPPQDDDGVKIFGTPWTAGDDGRSIRRPVRVPARQLASN
jgi:hypothetical protein